MYLNTEPIVCVQQEPKVMHWLLVLVDSVNIMKIVQIMNPVID